MLLVAAELSAAVVAAAALVVVVSSAPPVPSSVDKFCLCSPSTVADQIKYMYMYFYPTSFGQVRVLGIFVLKWS